MPFTTDQFFALFAAYNQAIGPAPIVAYVLAALALAAMLSGRAAGYRVALGILGLLWLWNGAAYHLVFFTRINGAAYGFAVLFVVQGGLFLWLAARAASGRAIRRRVLQVATGSSLVAYGAILYGILGRLSGHAWPAIPLFGVAPCPTVIFTFGLLMLAPRRVASWLLIVPLVWAAIGSSAAILLSVPEDLGLLVSGLIVAGWLIVRATQRGSRDKQAA